MRHVNFISAAWAVLAEGTPLEGKLEVNTAEKGATWANDFRAGAYDVCLGGWTGAAWDPGYFLLAYLSPDYMYSQAWDTSSVEMTFTMEGCAADGSDITATMSLMDWYNCLNGKGAYNFSASALPQEKRLPLIAALEKQVLQVYYSVPVSYSFAASLLSYKVDYITYEYNTFMGYGGMKYMKYNFTDAEWAAEVAAQGGELDYK
jgi:ABC-type oligopeptide transport system substrate-binding subunit